MQIVVVHGWQKAEAEVAEIIADTLGILTFEARQKIVGGGPTVLASFADRTQADELTVKLARAGVPAFVVGNEVLRSESNPLHVRRFVLKDQALQIESLDGELSDLNYDSIELLLVATGTSGQAQSTTAVTERKFSLGKTLLSGGVPMTKKVTNEQTVTTEERSETLWLYPSGQAAMIFDRAAMNYDGLGKAMQLTRDLNFAYLKNELRRLAPQAIYDDRLLKRAELVRVLGLNLSPETNLDLAFAILSRSLRPQSTKSSLDTLPPDE